MLRRVNAHLFSMSPLSSYPFTSWNSQLESPLYGHYYLHEQMDAITSFERWQGFGPSTRKNRTLATIVGNLAWHTIKIIKEGQWKPATLKTGLQKGKWNVGRAPNNKKWLETDHITQKVIEWSITLQNRKCPLAPGLKKKKKKSACQN